MFRLVAKTLAISFLINTSAFAWPITEKEAKRIAPGSLCTEDDPDFQEYRYPEQISYCRRNLSSARKEAIKRKFGIPREDWSLYQIDHVYSLWVGADNSDRNLMPITVPQHEWKNQMEAVIRPLVVSGEMTQSEALGYFDEWYHVCFFEGDCGSTIVRLKVRFNPVLSK
jgi:hypothetical protein